MAKLVLRFHPRQNEKSWQPRPSKNPRLTFDRTARQTLFLLSLLPAVLFIGMAAALLIRSWPIFERYSLGELLAGTTWKPTKGLFGFQPFIAGTIWVTTTGIFLAAPPCILTALYLSEYAGNTVRAVIKPLLDVLAAIPSVVYGVWGVTVIVPFVGDILRPMLSRRFWFIPFFTADQPTGYSILSGGIVLAVMIAPFIISVTYEVLRTIPDHWRQASYALGATRWQTICRVVARQALPGILASVVLGTSRAFGETMAVLMVVGNVPQIPDSIFDAAYPLPALIANNYGEMMSVPLYDAALLGAALILLMIVLAFNIASSLILNRMLRKPWN